MPLLMYSAYREEATSGIPCFHSEFYRTNYSKIANDHSLKAIGNEAKAKHNVYPTKYNLRSKAML